MSNRITSENITQLSENQIFCFGANEAGIHGAGSAKLAFDKFGAKMGIGCGFTGNCFAIPTKDRKIQKLPLSEIQKYIDNFISNARYHENLTFLVTAIGCGLANYKPSHIAPLFKNAIKLDNVHLPESFWSILNKI